MSANDVRRGFKLVRVFFRPGMKKSSPTRVGVKICRGVPVRGETICLDIGSGRIGVKIRRSGPFRGEKICLEIGSGRDKKFSGCHGPG